MTARIGWLMESALRVIGEGMTPAELAAELQVRPKDASRSLLRLHRLGMVRRQRVPHTRGQRGRCPYVYEVAP